MVTDTSEVIFEVIMRQLLLLSFALLPVAAHAQTKAVSSVAPAPTLTAALNQPAPVNSPRNAAAVTRVPAATSDDTATHLIGMHQTIRTSVSPDFEYPQGGTVGITFGEPNFAEMPKLEKYTTLALSQTDLAKSQPQTIVSVRLTLDAMGVPQDLAIVRSGGEAVDNAALAAVRNFRFKPATVEHVPVYSTMTVDITIDKK